jgi:hypothetical protein
VHPHQKQGKHMTTHKLLEENPLQTLTGVNFYMTPLLFHAFFRNFVTECTLLKKDDTH